MRYMGLDVHKDMTTACAIGAGGKEYFNANVTSDDTGLSVLHARMDGRRYIVLMESSTYVYGAFRYFERMGVEVHVAHAGKLKMITDSDNKTDELDARKVARYVRLWEMGELEISMSYMPTEVEAELKDICRYKEELSNKLSDEVRRIRSHMARNCLELPKGFRNLSAKKSREFIRATCGGDVTLMNRLDHYSFLLERSDEVRKEIEGRGGSKSVELLMSIPGIGRQTAVQIMSMIVDIDRFETAEKLCAYFGMTPRVRDSGGRQNHGQMTKAGDQMMRVIMKRVTLSHIQNCDSSITEYYKRKRNEIRNKALMAAARKMLAAIHAVLRRGTPFVA